MIDTKKAENSEILPVRIVRDVIVASFLTNHDAEAAIRRLVAGGVRRNTVSLVVRDYEPRKDAEAVYVPANAAMTGAIGGAWIGGIVGLLGGALGFVVVPFAGAFVAVGVVSAMIAGAVGGAGSGAVLNGLIAAGLPRQHALQSHKRLESGEILVIVHPDADQTRLVHEILEGADPSDLQTHHRQESAD
jgi:hypothetical protein